MDTGNLHDFGQLLTDSFHDSIAIVNNDKVLSTFAVLRAILDLSLHANFRCSLSANPKYKLTIPFLLKDADLLACRNAVKNARNRAPWSAPASSVSRSHQSRRLPSSRKGSASDAVFASRNAPSAPSTSSIYLRILNPRSHTDTPQIASSSIDCLCRARVKCLGLWVQTVSARVQR